MTTVSLRRLRQPHRDSRSRHYALPKSRTVVQPSPHLPTIKPARRDPSPTSLMQATVIKGRSSRHAMCSTQNTVLPQPVGPFEYHPASGQSAASKRFPSRPIAGNKALRRRDILRWLIQAWLKLQFGFGFRVSGFDVPSFRVPSFSKIV